MDEISLEVLEKADAVFERGYNEGLVDAIARAILAERKRCLKAVRDELPVWVGDEYGHGKEVACENIIDAIESGQ